MHCQPQYTKFVHRNHLDGHELRTHIGLKYREASNCTRRQWLSSSVHGITDAPVRSLVVLHASWFMHVYGYLCIKMSPARVGLGYEALRNLSNENVWQVSELREKVAFAVVVPLSKFLSRILRRLMYISRLGYYILSESLIQMIMMFRSMRDCVHATRFGTRL